MNSNTTKGNSDLKNNRIVEKKLGISPDYQYRALRTGNFFQANWHKNKFYILNKLIGLNKKMEVLDLGTGSGNFELIFSKEVKNIVAVDYNDGAITFLRKNLILRKIKNVRLICEDIKNLHKQNGLGKFDLIVIVDTIEHIRVSEGNKLISQLRKYLKKEGKVCVITPNRKSTWPLIEWLLDKFTVIPKFANEQHLAKYDKTRLANIFLKYGYKIEKNCSFNLFSFLIPSEKLSQFFAYMETKSPITAGNLLIGIYSYNSKDSK